MRTALQVVVLMLAGVGCSSAHTDLERHAGEMLCGKGMIAWLGGGPDIECHPAEATRAQVMHGPGRPEPCCGIVGASGHSVSYGAECDLAELLAASREWAKLGPITPPERSWSGITVRTLECGPCKCGDHGPSCLRHQADQMEREAADREIQRQAESRCRKAVEACGK